MKDNWIDVNIKLPPKFTHVLIITNISIKTDYAFYAIDDWLYFTNQENFWLKTQPHIKVISWMLPPKIEDYYESEGK